MWGSDVQPLEALLCDPSEVRKAGSGQMKVLLEHQVLLEH